VELAPIDGIPAIGAWLGAFTSPAGKFIWAVNVGVVGGEVSGRSLAPVDGIPSTGAWHHPLTSVTNAPFPACQMDSARREAKSQPISSSVAPRAIHPASRNAGGSYSSSTRHFVWGTSTAQKA
jgi:hypothetical protein